MNYKEVMDYINNVQRLGSNLGLERTEKLLELLGNPHKKLKCIHIAGTNGKGSTTAIITQILIEAGYKVGMYTSPYIEDFEERIQINRKNIPKDDLVKIINKVSVAVNEVIKLGYSHPTQFEIITCGMFLYFYNQNVDYAVIEVGLGGRLDSTNVITPLLSIITSISYDHMEILGNTLSEIAYEKAGIIKDNVPVVLYPQKIEAQKVIEQIAINKNSKIIKVNKNCVNYIETHSINDNGQKLLLQKIKITTSNNSYSLEFALLGKHQLLNCATAVYAAEELIKLGIKINKTHIVNGIKNVKWPARMEIIKSYPWIVLDGAHNIDGITKLTQSIPFYFKYNKLILILGILKDKKVDDMVKEIVPMAQKVITVTPNSNRAETCTELKKIVKKYNSNCEAILDYKEAFNKAFSCCNKDDLLLICGSLYMVGDMRKIIKERLL